MPKNSFFANTIKKFMHGHARPVNYDKQIMHPVREWLIGLCVFAGIIVIGGVQSIHTFLQYQNVNTQNGSYDGKVVHFNEAGAKTVLAAYAKRGQLYEQLQSGSASTTATPSASSTVQSISGESATTSAPTTTGSQAATTSADAKAPLRQVVATTSEKETNVTPVRH